MGGLLVKELSQLRRVSFESHSDVGILVVNSHDTAVGASYNAILVYS